MNARVPGDLPVPQDSDLDRHLEAMASSLDLLTAELDEAPNAPRPFKAPLRFLRHVVRRLMGRMLGTQTRYNLANYELSRLFARRFPDTDSGRTGRSIEGPTLREELLGHDALVLQAVKKHLDTLADERRRHDAEIASRLSVLDDRLARLERTLTDGNQPDRSSDRTESL